MTINDLQLVKHIRKMKRNFALIDYLTREGNQDALFKAISNVEVGADRALNRLNHMKFKKGP